MRKRRVSIALAFSLVLGLGVGPAVAYAEGEETPAETAASAESEELGAPSADEAQNMVLAAEAEAEDVSDTEGDAAPENDAEPTSFMGLEADSFRYRDGKPIEGLIDTGGSEAYDDELTAMADTAWKKNSSGQYVSSNGSVIPGALRRGVDVSEFQGEIDWAKAKADDVGFAILRCGGTFYVSRKQYNDDYFERNASECERLNIPYGAYFFSSAMSVQDAIKEADFTIAKLKGKNVTLPVYYDLEYEEAAKKLSTSDWAAIAKAYCDRIAAAGYTPGIYANLNWWEHYLTDPVFNNWTRWVAQYYSRCEYGGTYDCWQCSSIAPVAGIKGGVDLNFDFGIDAASNQKDFPSDVVERVWGESKVDTMAAIVQKGWSQADTVLVATTGGYWDALSASSLAGSFDAPVLLSDPLNLNAQTADEIRRLGAKKAIVIGGPVAINDSVIEQLKAAGVSDVKRVWGDDAEATARKVAEELGTEHADTCFIATAGGYWDALAASPIAYAKGMPIFLTQRSTGLLDAKTLETIKAGGYRRVVIAGGKVAVPTGVEDQLKSIGIAASNINRKWGNQAIQTSSALAEYGLGLGLGANKLGVATAYSYYDALTGGALCGKNKAVLILATPSDCSSFNDFVSSRTDLIDEAYVFGGHFAIPHSLFNTLVRITG